MTSNISNERTIGGIPLKKFSKDFTNPITPHDCVIVVEGQKFYVLAGHLSFCSEFFLTMFNSSFKEKDQQEIEIEELSAEDFHLFLQMLVVGNHSIITANNFLSIMACARRFLAPEVVSLCETFVVDNFEKLDKIDLLKMAFDYNLEEFKEMMAKDSMKLIVPKEEHCRNKCQDTSQLNYCSDCREFYPKKSPLFNKESFLAKNKERLTALPDEMNAFIFKFLLKNI